MTVGVHSKGLSGADHVLLFLGVLLDVPPESKLILAFSFENIDLVDEITFLLFLLSKLIDLD